MSRAQTTSRALTHTLMRHVAHILAGRRETWARAMAAEADGIESDLEALAWALGCIRAGYIERLREFGMRMSSFAYDLWSAIGVTAVFVSLFIYVDGYLAALSYPRWYAEVAGAHRHFSIHLWVFLKQGVPEAFIAAACAVALAYAARGSRAFVATSALCLWIAAPFVVDLSGGDISVADYLYGFAMYWPDIALRLAFVSLTFLSVFLFVASWLRPCKGQVRRES